MADGKSNRDPGGGEGCACDKYREQISAYLDGELDAEGRGQLEPHVLGCAACRREYETMKRLVIGTTAALAVEEPSDEIWDDFLDGVYNRLERKSGWIILIVGVVALAIFGAYHFVTEPWGSALEKVLFAAPVVGLVVLFVSVLRQRLVAARTDRYSREVYR